MQQAAGSALTLTPRADGTVEVAVPGYLSPEVEAAIVAAAPVALRGTLAEEAKRYRAETEARLSPADKGAEFVAPRLMAEVQGELVWADTDTFMEVFDWSLLDTPLRLTEGEFSLSDNANQFAIDVTGQAVTYSYIDEQMRLAFDVPVDGWNEVNLSVWLDRKVRQPDILPSELLKWLRDGVTHLTQARGIDMPKLWRAKYRLAQIAEAKIKAVRSAAREQAYQLYLFAPEAKATISFDEGFRFFKGMYDGVRRHRGGAYRFGKHFLGPDHLPALSGMPGDAGEEAQCAQALDTLLQVDYWLRNVAQHDNSFRLPLAGGNFYPDFVARLTNGRIFVVEYKGAHLAGAGNDDTNEKRMVGELWERSTGGLFLMVEKEIDGLSMRQQMLRKLGSQ